MLFLHMHKKGELIWQLLFSMHMFYLALILWKHVSISRIISGLIFLGSIGYLGDALLRLLEWDIPGLHLLFNIGLAAAVAGELAFTFYLLFKAELKERLMV